MQAFIPDGSPLSQALSRTTHLAIGAHPDDLEIMAFHGIAESYRKKGRWFTGIVCTTGSGSARSGAYRKVSDLKMAQLRWKEQCKAATLGRYSAVIGLQMSSSQVKSRKSKVAQELLDLLLLTLPKVAYIHNPADSHATHVAASLAAISALRKIPDDQKPKKVFGCEVWRTLDWLPDRHKTYLDISRHQKLAQRLISLFHSQIGGGKRFDRATLGRWSANATYREARAVDRSQAAILALDLTPLVHHRRDSIKKYFKTLLQQTSTDVLRALP